MTLREARNRLFRNGLLQRLVGPTALAAGALCALPAVPGQSSPYNPRLPAAPPPATLTIPAKQADVPPIVPPTAAATAPRPTMPAQLPDLPPAPAPSTPPPAGADLPGQMSPDEAIRWALNHNPEIAALRQQHGIALAGVLIAKQYPFNPIWESAVFGATGPPGAVTNSVPLNQRVTLELEVFHQGKIRREAAAAALSRTDWEIASLEVALAVRVVRGFDGVVYRFRKRRLIEETLKLNQQALQEVQKLLSADQPGVTKSDEILLRAEVRDSAAQLSPAQTALVTAWQELYRALGVTAGAFDLRGGLEPPPVLEDEAEGLLQVALERRPDLRAHQVAVREADARMRLEVRNRYGNPSVGPSYEYNETRVSFIGMAVVMPLPVLNTHRGEIQQRAAERTRAVLELSQNEVMVRQEVRAALARLEQARRWVDSYQHDVLPDLEKALKEIRALYKAAAGGADLLRVLDVQRKLLHARDIELDAVLELRQALADLALAVGDPSLAVPPCAEPK